MKFAIHCIDHPGKTSDRLTHYEAHKAHLAAGPVSIVVSGPLVASDGETMIGSLFIVEADRIEDVEAFNAQDPFNKAGIWAAIQIHPFLLRIDNRS